MQKKKYCPGKADIRKVVLCRGGPLTCSCRFSSSLGTGSVPLSSSKSFIVPGTVVQMGILTYCLLVAYIILFEREI